MNRKLTDGKSREYASALRAAWRERNPGVHLSSEEEESDETLIISSEDEPEIEVVKITSKEPVGSSEARPRGRKIMAALENVRKENEKTKCVRNTDESKSKVQQSSEQKKVSSEMSKEFKKNKTEKTKSMLEVENQPSTSREGQTLRKKKNMDKLNISSRKFKEEMEKIVKEMEAAEERDALAKKFRDKARKLMMGKFKEKLRSINERADQREEEGEMILQYLQEEGMISRSAQENRQSEASQERIVIRLPNRPVARTPSPESQEVLGLEVFAEDQREEDANEIAEQEPEVSHAEKIHDWKLRVNPVVCLERIRVPKPKRKKPRIIASQRIFVKVKVTKPTEKVKELKTSQPKVVKVEEAQTKQGLDEEEEKIPATRMRKARPNILRDISSDEEDKQCKKEGKKLHPKKRVRFVKAYRANLELQGELYSCIDNLGESEGAERCLELYEEEQSCDKSKTETQVTKKDTSADTSATLSAITAVVPYTGCPPELGLEEQEGGMKPTAEPPSIRASTAIGELSSQEDADSLLEWILQREEV